MVKYDQQMPASQEAEQEMLGMVLLDPSILDETTIESDDFYWQQHRVMWNVITKIWLEHNHVDITQLAETLKQQNKLDEVGGMPFLVGVMEIHGTALMWHSTQNVIKERRKQRNIINASGKAMTDAFNLVETNQIMSELDAFVTKTDPGSDNNYENALTAAARYATGEALVPTGLTYIDRAVGGFTRNDFTVIGARTSTGKSAFIHRIADNIAHAEGGPVTIFTPDQPIPEVLAMQAARECGVPLAYFRHKQATEKQQNAYLQAVANLENGFLQRLDFRSGMLTLQHFERETIRAIRNGSVAIIVDTINRLSGKQDHKHALIAEFGSLAKSIAADYDVPVIGLAQVRREMDWEDRDPTRADLADAPGSLANDANMIMLLNRNQADRHEGKMHVILDKVKADKAGQSIRIDWDDNFVMPHNGDGVKEITAHKGQESLQL